MSGEEKRPRTGAVVVAAGSGSRFGGGKRKQFLELAGIPVLEWAIRAFRAHEAVDEVVVVVPQDVAADPPDWLLRGGVGMVVGGASRAASVARGLARLAGVTDRVLVHDGVRPFASARLIRRVAEAAEWPVVPVLPVVDTVKEVDGTGRVVGTLDRSRLVRVQTPQGFPAALLRSVHSVPPSGREGSGAGEDGAEAEGAGSDGERVATDDAALCEARGHRVRTVRGEERNLKITSVADYDYARWLVAEGRVRPAGDGRSRTG